MGRVIRPGILFPIRLILEYLEIQWKYASAKEIPCVSGKFTVTQGVMYNLSSKIILDFEILVFYFILPHFSVNGITGYSHFASYFTYVASVSG